QERYKDDREQLGRQMMELYKREKINPLAGCLPILIQIPFFLAFYWVLLESVEMRQAPFLGWITDLSARDPYFILPLLMGAAMFAQFKLQPMPSADPIQAKIFMFMPLIMAVMMAWFPAGLVLYWLTNTLLSIAQQWRINKFVAAEQRKPYRVGTCSLLGSIGHALHPSGMNDPSSGRTIAAIATPPGRGGIGVIRVSGPKVRAIAESLLGAVPAP